MSTISSDIIERLTYTVREAAQAVGVCSRTMGDMLRAGTIRSVRAGRRVLVPVDAVEEYLRGQGPQTAA